MSEMMTEPSLSSQQEPGEQSRGNPLGKLAGYIERAGRGERAALARLDPTALRPHQIAALSRALLAAGLKLEKDWKPETWQRWALIAHGMALAGHDGTGRLGHQLAQAGVAESRVTKLLTARGDAFKQLLPQLLRLLASKGVRPNWFDLGNLALKESKAERQDQEQAEDLRLRIAGGYFAAMATKSQ